MLKRKLDRLLAAGQGRQLLWLLIAVIAVFLLFWCISAALPGWNFKWQDIMALILDSGNFGGEGEHDIFRLTVALVGMFLFSALLISVFTNIFDNISEAVKKGERRYRLKDHLLILGSGPQVVPMLRQFFSTCPDRLAVIMTTSDVERLSKEVAAGLQDGKLMRNVVFYYGERVNRTSLESACANAADMIYIIGEPGEDAHDSANLMCYRLVKEIVEEKPLKKVLCFLTLENESSMSVMQYDKSTGEGDGNLVLEVVNAMEYDAEQLLVYRDFLPVLKADSDRYSHIVIFGTSEMANAFAFVAAHISHYPNFMRKDLRTKITFVGEGMRKWMDRLVASRPGLFELSRYEYVAPDGTFEMRLPDAGCGDFLDIEWQFIDSYESSPLVAGLLSEWASDDSQELVIAACNERQQDRVDAVLNLPEAARKCPICIWVQDQGSIISMAVQTGMYGNIVTFGNASVELTDPLFLQRAGRGMRVNYIYEQMFGDKSLDASSAWASLPVSHKFSSIESANAIPLRQRCFDGCEVDRMNIYETEHRRWMMSELLMGYRAYPVSQVSAAREQGLGKELKSRFIHLDIVPFDMLPDSEKEKDRVIIDNMEYILTGENLRLL